jgi:excisionase family DNA binding protein
VLYTVKEVSEILKTNVSYVHSLRKSGLLPFIKLGTYKVRKETLAEFLATYENYDLTDPKNIKPLTKGGEIMKEKNYC